MYIQMLFPKLLSMIDTMKKSEARYLGGFVNNYGKPQCSVNCSSEVTFQLQPFASSVI